MRWTATDVVLPLLLWFRQGMMQQHPPPAVGEAVDGGGGEEQDDGGLLHPPHPKDDPPPQYFQLFFGGFGGFFETGGYLSKWTGTHIELRTKTYFLSYQFLLWMCVCEVLRSQNFSRPLYSFKTTFSCLPLYSKLRIYPSFKAEDLLFASKPRPYTQCTLPFYILESLETFESYLEAVSLFQQDKRLRVPSLYL
jgi:hypothetical protein